MSDCLFCRIVSGSLPSTIVYRDEYVTAFQDIQPQAPVHVLVVPNEHIASTNDLAEQHDQAMGRLFRAAAAVAREQGIAESGYRLVVNTGPDAMQSVFHLHLHVIGGRRMHWPPG